MYILSIILFVAKLAHEVELPIASSTHEAVGSNLPMQAIHEPSVELSESCTFAAWSVVAYDQPVVW